MQHEYFIIGDPYQVATSTAAINGNHIVEDQHAYILLQVIALALSFMFPLGGAAPFL